MNETQLIEELEAGRLSYYNLYNADQSNDVLASAKLYARDPSDNERPQKLTCGFTDIELYQFSDKSNKSPDDIDFKETSDRIVNSITYLSERSKTFYLQFLVREEHFDKVSSAAIYKLADELLRPDYILDDEKLEVILYDGRVGTEGEERLLRDYWKIVFDDNASILSGFYADMFDYPYMYRRTKVMCPDDYDQVMTKYGPIKDNMFGGISIPTFAILDQRRLYATGDSGGLSYGKKLTSFSLKRVSAEVLGESISKLDYSDGEDKYRTLDHFYIEAPVGFAVYNIADTALCARINDRLGFVDLHNGIRRDTNCTMSRSIIGASSIFDAYTFGNHYRNGESIRCNLKTELNTHFDEDHTIPLPRGMRKNKPIEHIEVDAKTFTSISCKFSGAYVKNALPSIISAIVGAVDATALYPCMMMQHNIDWRTLVCRIIDPVVEPILSILVYHLGPGRPQLNLELLTHSVYRMVVDYVDREDLASKKKKYSQYYNSIMGAVKVLSESGYPMESIMNPMAYETAILLKKYLLPLIDIISTLKRSEVHNPIAYDYMFLSKEDFRRKYVNRGMLILNDITNPTQYLTTVPALSMESIASRYIITVTGCVFRKHQDLLGFCPAMLDHKLVNRNKFVSLADAEDDNPILRKFYRNKEQSLKKNVNSWYGINGLQSYRYSSHHIAHAITTSGKLSVKLMQSIIESELPGIMDEYKIREASLKDQNASSIYIGA